MILLPVPPEVTLASFKEEGFPPIGHNPCYCWSGRSGSNTLPLHPMQDRASNTMHTNLKCKGNKFKKLG
jgi:hypothetical protein